MAQGKIGTLVNDKGGQSGLIYRFPYPAAQSSMVCVTLFMP